MSKVHIATAIEKAKTERAARTGITADRALAEVWAVATADPREGYVWLVEALGLDVSVQSVRKAALKGGWAKVTPGNHAKASVTIKTTMPTTMPEAISGPCDGGVVTAGREGESALTPREERFVQEYLVDLSAAQAYARAYPDAAEASARQAGNNRAVSEQFRNV